MLEAMSLTWCTWNKRRYPLKRDKAQLVCADTRPRRCPTPEPISDARLTYPLTKRRNNTLFAVCVFILQSIKCI